MKEEIFCNYLDISQQFRIKEAGGTGDGQAENPGMR